MRYYSVVNNPSVEVARRNLELANLPMIPVTLYMEGFTVAVLQEEHGFSTES